MKYGGSWTISELLIGKSLWFHAPSFISCDISYFFSAIVFIMAWISFKKYR